MTIKRIKKTVAIPTTISINPVPIFSIESYMFYSINIFLSKASAERCSKLCIFNKNLKAKQNYFTKIIRTVFQKVTFFFFCDNRFSRITDRNQCNRLQCIGQMQCLPTTCHIKVTYPARTQFLLGCSQTKCSIAMAKSISAWSFPSDLRCHDCSWSAHATIIHGAVCIHSRG